MKLSWRKLESTKVEKAALATYENGNITRVVYSSIDSSESTKAEPVLVAYFFNATGYAYLPGQPFYIQSLEKGIVSFSDEVQSTREEPSRLMICQDCSGSGAYTTWHWFKFTPQGAILTSRTESGRHIPSRNHEYNDAGDLISKVTEDKE